MSYYLNGSDAFRLKLWFTDKMKYDSIMENQQKKKEDGASEEEKKEEDTTEKEGQAKEALGEGEVQKEEAKEEVNAPSS